MSDEPTIEDRWRYEQQRAAERQRKWYEDEQQRQQAEREADKHRRHAVAHCPECDTPIPADFRAGNSVYCTRCREGWKYYTVVGRLVWESLSVVDTLAWRRLAEQFPAVPAAPPQPAPTVMAQPEVPTTDPEPPALRPNEWQILRVLAAQPNVAMTQADIGDNTDPKLSIPTVGRLLRKLRERGLTQPLDGGGECITTKGLSLVNKCES